MSLKNNKVLQRTTIFVCYLQRYEPLDKTKYLNLEHFDLILKAKDHFGE